mmetsp:Transcript_26737/g.30387  ORF Transcript_26737/g.30387 Transcript_26737/m.30387 type:complete len:88 (-) Transcript_26737:163-426(-)
MIKIPKESDDRSSTASEKKIKEREWRRDPLSFDPERIRRSVEYRLREEMIERTTVREKEKAMKQHLYDRCRCRPKKIENKISGRRLR